MTYTVLTPNTEFNGRLAGLRIYEGMGQTDDPRFARRLMTELGCTVTPPPPVFITKGKKKGGAKVVMVDADLFELLEAYEATDLVPDQHDGILGLEDVRKELEKKAKKNGSNDLPPIPPPPEPEEDEPE